MKRYSTGLRSRLMNSYEAGEETQQEISDRYKIHLSTFKRIYKQYRETGSVEMSPNQAGRPSSIDESGYTIIKRYVLDKPDATLAEIKQHYQTKKKISLSLSMVCRSLQLLNLRRKKKSLYAAEQEREDIKKKDWIIRRKHKE